MNKILDLVTQIKGQLKESITTELTPEEINKVALIDKSLDDLTEQVSKLQKDYDDLKDTYIEQVKNTGFKPTGSTDDDIGLGETKTIDEILVDELKTLERA